MSSLTNVVPQTYVVSGLPGATVTGQGTGTLVITGTVAQVNSYLSDGLAESLLSNAYEKAQKAANSEKVNLAAEAFTISFALSVTLLNSGFLELSKDVAKELENQAIKKTGLMTNYDAPGTLLKVDVGLFSFAANVLNDVAAIAGGATEFPPAAGGDDGDPHVVTFSGQSYQFEAAGEFLLAGSKVASNSFTVEARYQPIANSTVGSQITQIAAQVGADRVTIDATRASTVYVNGVAVSLVVNHPVKLDGGELSGYGRCTRSPGTPAKP